MREVVMPKSSMTMTEGELTKWLVDDGDEVKEGDPIAIILTDKVEMEVEAPEDGRVGIMTEEGKIVPVGHAIAVILGTGEDKPADAALDAVSAADGTVPQGASPEPLAEGTVAETPRARVVVEDARAEGARGKLRASPAARAMAKRLGVDLQGVKGSGPRGRIRPADVVAHARPSPPAPAARQRPAVSARPGGEAAGETPRHRPSGVRGVMARRMQEAAFVPQFTLFADVALVAAERARAVAKREGLGAVTLTDVLLRALAVTLPEHAILNSHYVDGEVVSYAGVNVGVAVDTDEGLIVPVVSDVQDLDLSALSRRRNELTTAARIGRLRPDEVTGATFTLTNLGMFGVNAFQPVVNPPQVAILGVGGMRGDAGRTATLALGGDHRVVDGAQGARFLASLRELLEYPRLLFDGA